MPSWWIVTFVLIDSIPFHIYMGEIKFKIKNYYYFSYFFSIKLTQFPFREIIGHMNIFEDECFILNDKDDKKNKFR